VGSLPGTSAVGDVRWLTGATTTGGLWPIYGTTATSTWTQLGYQGHGDGSITVACSVPMNCTVRVTPGVFAATANNLSDLASAATARTNLGLGTVATLAQTGGGSTVVTTNGVTAGRVAFVDANSRLVSVTGSGAFVRPDGTTGDPGGGGGGGYRLGIKDGWTNDGAFACGGTASRTSRAH
jgi:hypothetical protein